MDTQPTPAKTSVTNPPAGDDPVLDAVAQAARQLYWADLVRRGVLTWLAIAGGIAAWVLIDHQIGVGSTSLRIVAATVLIGGGFWLIGRFISAATRQIDPVYAARAIERDQPHLRGMLSSYVELRQSDGLSSPAGLSSRMIRAAGRTADARWDHDAPVTEATGTLPYWIVGVATLAAVLIYAIVSPKSTTTSIARALLPTADIAVPRRVTIDNVAPGDAPANPGRPLWVAADIRSMTDDETPRCELLDNDETIATKILTADDSSLDRYAANLDIPATFAGPLTYRITAGDAATRRYRLEVADLPVVEVTNLAITPPAYTGIAAYQSTNPAIRAPDGSTVTITARVNRAVSDAVIELNPVTTTAANNTATSGASTGTTTGANTSTTATGGTVAMRVGGSGASRGNVLTATLTLRGQSRRRASAAADRYRIVVRGTDGSVNQNPIVHPIEIIDDLSPEITITQPTTSPVRLPIDAARVIRAAAIDPDYGLSKIVMRMESGITRYDPIVLFEAPNDQPHRGNKVVEYRLRPRRIGLRVGDKLTVTLTAIDNRDLPAATAADPLNGPLNGPAATTADPVEIIIDPAANPESEEETRDQPEQKKDPDGNTSEDGSNGQQQSGENQGGQQSDQSQTGQGEGGEPDNPQGQSEKQGDSNQQSKSDQQGDASESSQQSPSGDNQSSEGQPSGDQPQSEPQQGGDQSSESGQPSELSDGQPSDGQPSGQPGQNESAEGQSQPAGDQSGNREGLPQDDTPSQPPSHDGEAFERIRDHIEQQNQEDSRQSTEKSNSSTSEDSTEPSPRDNERSSDESSGDSSDNPSDGDEQPSESGNQTPSESNQPSSEGDPSQSESTDGKPTDGKPTDGKPTDGEPSDGESPNGEPSNGEPTDGEPSSSDAPPQGQPSEGQPNQSESGDNEASQTPPPSDTGQPSQTQPDGDPPSDAPQQNADQSNPTGRQAGDRGPDTGDGPATPDPVDLDYADEATDMVLDYLEKNKDQSDPDLLDKLNWTPEQLEAFRRRWQSAKQIDRPGDPQQQQNLDQALQSLGMRRPGDLRADTPQTADDLRGLRDGGNRRPAPPAYRDAFDRFRRSLGERR